LTDKRGNLKGGPLSMSIYHHKKDPCFAKGCPVRLLNGKTVGIEMLKAEITVWTPKR